MATQCVVQRRPATNRCKPLLIKLGARITVERVVGLKDHETARAILDGRISGTSLNVEEPTLTDLAEQMLWAAGSCDAEIVRMCLPYMTRKSDDPWWNYVLMHATLPECFQLVLDHGIEPERHRRGRPHNAAPPGDGHRRRRAPHHSGNAVDRCRRVAQQARSITEVNATGLGVSLGPYRACQSVPGTRRGRGGIRCRTVGNSRGLGYEGRASRNYRFAPAAWQQRPIVGLQQ